MPKVTTTSNDGPGSLRQVIADVIPEDNTITFDISQYSPNTIVLSELIRIDKSLTIEGPGADKLIISGNNATSIFFIDNISTPISVNLNGISLTNSYHENFNGAIHVGNSATLNITKCNLSNNQCGSGGGGAIYNTGTLNIHDSVLAYNTANDGGAICNAGGTLTISNSMLSECSCSNFGGAIYNYGTLTIRDSSTLSGNKGTTDGGAIYNEQIGTVTITASTLSANRAGINGGAVYNKGSITIKDKCTLSENTAVTRWGGAIYNKQNGEVDIADSNLSDNVAFACGAIANDGTLTITKSTLSGNSIISSSPNSGAIGNSGTLTLTACELTANSDGVVGNDGQLTIEESTFSENNSYWGGAIYNFNKGALIVKTSKLSNNVAELGGAIYNEKNGSVTIEQSILSGNSSGSDYSSGDGGAIVNQGILTIKDNSTLSANTAKNCGGAIYNEESGSVTITASTLSANVGINGGAIYNLGTITIQDNCTLSGNMGKTDGGAIYNNQNGIFTIADSRLLGNKAIDGGAIFNDTALTIASSITNTDLNENNASNSNYKGGAVYNNGTLLISVSSLKSNGKIGFCGAIYNHGHLTIEKSTLSDNIGYFGGAINTDGTLIVKNSTLTTNTASINMGGTIYITGYNSSTRIDSSTLVSNNAGYGGAIYTENAGPLTIINSTLSQNKAEMAGDALSTLGGTIDIFFSTIVDNFSSGTAAIYCTASTTTCNSSILDNFYINCYGSNITGIGQNLCTDESCPGSIVVTREALKLEPLGVNPPGTMPTYALQDGSVALNIVESCNVEYDQRGVLRPKSGADAGAYEKAQALLEIIENTSPENPLVAQQFTYTINIHNFALVPLTNVTVTDKLSIEFDFITASEGYNFDQLTRKISWTPATIEVDQPLTVTVTVLPRNAGTFINSVTAAINDYPTAIDNYPTIVYERKMLAIDNESSPENPTVGYPFTYTIIVRNTGQSPVKDVTVTDKLPDSVDIVTSSEQHLIRSGGEVTWTLDALSPGQSITFTLKVRPRQIGLITNTITATSPDSQTAVCTYQTTVRAAMTFAVNIQTITSWSYPSGMRDCVSLCALDEFLRLNRLNLVTLNTLGGWSVTGLVADYDDCIVRLIEATLT